MTGFVGLCRPDRSVFAVACLWSAVAWAQSDQGSPAAQIEGIFEKHCHSCHGRNGSIEGGMNYILDARRLIARKIVVSGKPQESLLWQRVNDREMPPDDATISISDAEIETIRKWIEEGAARFGKDPSKRPFIDNERLLQWMADDLAAAKTADRPSMRYFTITHLYNQGLSDDELQTYRNGLSKLVNSLS